MNSLELRPGDMYMDLLDNNVSYLVLSVKDGIVTVLITPSIYGEALYAYPTGSEGFDFSDRNVVCRHSERLR